MNEPPSALPPGVTDALFAGILGGNLLWIITGVVLTIFVGHALIVVYHWLRYGLSSGIMMIAMLIYFGVSAVLAGLLLITTAVLV